MHCDEQFVRLGRFVGSVVGSTVAGFGYIGDHGEDCDHEQARSDFCGVEAAVDTAFAVLAEVDSGAGKPGPAAVVGVGVVVAVAC